MLSSFTPVAVGHDVIDHHLAVRSPRSLEFFDVGGSSDGIGVLVRHRFFFCGLGNGVSSFVFVDGSGTGLFLFVADGFCCIILNIRNRRCLVIQLPLSRLLAPRGPLPGG